MRKKQICKQAWLPLSIEGLLPTLGRLFVLALIFVFALSGPAVAAGGEGEGSFADFGWRTVNFLILAALLFYLLAKKIRALFLERKDDVLAALKEAQNARERAELKYREVSAKLAAADEEIAALRRMIEAQGQTERDKILAEANHIAARIKEEAKARMEQEYARLSRELQAEAVNLSLSMAEKILQDKITQADRENMVRGILRKIGTEKGKQVGAPWLN